MGLYEDRLRGLLRVRSVRYGLPFLILILGGSFGLKQFAQLRYTYSTNVKLRPEELAKHGITMKKRGEVTLESEYEKVSKLDIDNWENVRGPRPWEST